MVTANSLSQKTDGECVLVESKEQLDSDRKAYNGVTRMCKAVLGMLDQSAPSAYATSRMKAGTDFDNAFCDAVMGSGALHDIYSDPVAHARVLMRYITTQDNGMGVKVYGCQTRVQSKRLGMRGIIDLVLEVVDPAIAIKYFYKSHLAKKGDLIIVDLKYTASPSIMTPYAKAEKCDIPGTDLLQKDYASCYRLQLNFYRELLYDQYSISVRPEDVYILSMCHRTQRPRIEDGYVFPDEWNAVLKRAMELKPSL
jgi:hypothetical protein